MNINTLYNIYLEYPSVVTDTRKVKQGDIFFALKGPNFNGNTFAAQALQKGAAYAVIDETVDAHNDKTILVEDCLSALQQLAAHHRQQFNIPFLAITGSNGKTTTKELIHAVLSSKYITYTTEGNLNNHIGVPLTILKIKKDAEFAVIEMGANHQKEIEGYCVYTKPTHGLITNCGKAHIEGFGSEEGVIKGKGELFDFIRNNGGTAFVYQDQPCVVEIAEGIRKIIPYGTTGSTNTASVKTNAPFLEVAMNNGLIMSTKLVGDYNLPNVAAAVAVGREFGLEDGAIKMAIENYTPSNSRSQLMQKGSNKIILDAYNANPSSMKAAIENFAAMQADKKILVLGGMMELGTNSIKDHTEIIKLIGKHKWDAVALVGKDYVDLPSGVRHFNNSDEVAKWFKEQQFSNVHILIKGSRGMKMENALNGL